MQRAWTSFARTGRPDLGGEPEWPAHEPKRRYTMTLGGGRGVLKDPHEGAREFWEPLIPLLEVPSSDAL
jgi:carboxylesterase type B